MKNIIIGVVTAALLAVTSWALLCRKPSAKPPSVVIRPDTTWLTDTSYVVDYRIDPAASKELTKLRNELDRQQSLIGRLTGYLAEMDEENRYLADSLARVTLDSVRGFVKVERGPTGIRVTAYQGGEVQTFKLPMWRQRFTILAGKDRPVVKTSRLPFDLGLYATGGLNTTPDSWAPTTYIWAGLSITRQALTAMVGPYYDGKLKLRGDLRLDWRF